MHDLDKSRFVVGRTVVMLAFRGETRWHESWVFLHLGVDGLTHKVMQTVTLEYTKLVR
jgi:hypothetical protein